MLRNKTLGILMLLAICFMATSCTGTKFEVVESSSSAPGEVEEKSVPQPEAPPETEPVVPSCNLTTHELISNRCLVKCASNQTRNVSLQCVAIPPVCNLITHDSIGNSCLVKCGSNQVRNVTTLACQNSQCSNGTSNYPACNECGANRHLENGICVSNSRSCLPQPADTVGGYQLWTGSAWGACQNYSCAQGFFKEGAACVKGCEEVNPSWGRWGLGIELRCGGTVPRLRDGQSTVVQSTNGQPGHIKVSCVNSQHVFTPEPTYTNHLENEWSHYLVKVFKNQPVDIACNNQLIEFQKPRLWEDCQTASTATCFAQQGSNPTQTNACWAIKVYADDLGIHRTTLVDGKYLGQHFGTQFKIFIRTSKDNFATAHEITNDVSSGYGQMLDSQNPQELYGGRPPGFSFVARKDLANHQVKISIEATSFLNGVIRQSRTGETTINIRPNESCPDGYDGRGVANFVIGASLTGESSTTMVRRGQPFPLHSN